ncbi:MAG: aconitase X [Pseudomonadota bacterium]
MTRPPATHPSVILSDDDRADLDGSRGAAAQWAMKLVLKVAQSLGAPRLVSIGQAHLVGAYHSGPANLAFLCKLVSQGARVRVPTTLNSSSADLTSGALPCYAGRDRDQARAVVDSLSKMGCRATLTCAPYLLSGAPRFGENIAWAESNAVLFANSVIGARSLKCSQYLDLACALSGRTPYAEVMMDKGRQPALIVDVEHLSARWFDDRVGFQFVGFATGAAADTRISFLRGLPRGLDWTALQALCAAAGVSGSMAMLHVEGSTPEAGVPEATLDRCDIVRLDDQDLVTIAKQWRPSQDIRPVAVCVGAPHAGIEELTEIASTLERHADSVRLPFVVSVGRGLYADARLHAVFERLRSGGVTLVRDTCTYYGPLFGGTTGHVLTNSVKWAAYAAAGMRCTPVIATLGECVDAALRASYTVDRAYWNATFSRH